MTKGVSDNNNNMYEFTQDWFTSNIPVWQVMLAEYMGKPVHALEIGSFEGRSAIWLLDNVLTHPEASLTCIDPFCGSHEHDSKTMAHAERRFRNNVLLRRQNVTFHKGHSQHILLEPKLQGQCFDIIYIDGEHTSRAVLQDLILAFPLLRVGGRMIIDDFLGNPQDLTSPTTSAFDGIRAFLAAYSKSIFINYAGYQMILTKTAA